MLEKIDNMTVVFRSLKAITEDPLDCSFAPKRHFSDLVFPTTKEGCAASEEPWWPLYTHEDCWALY